MTTLAAECSLEGSVPVDQKFGHIFVDQLRGIPGYHSHARGVPPGLLTIDWERLERVRAQYRGISSDGRPVPFISIVQRK